MKLPLALVFVASSAGAIAALATTSCGGDDSPACALHCEVAFPTFDDAGVMIDATPVTCPECADPVTFTCPAGCDPVG